MPLTSQRRLDAACWPGRSSTAGWSTRPILDGGDLSLPCRPPRRPLDRGDRSRVGTRSSRGAAPPPDDHVSALEVNGLPLHAAVCRSVRSLTSTVDPSARQCGADAGPVDRWYRRWRARAECPSGRRHTDRRRGRPSRDAGRTRRCCRVRDHHGQHERGRRRRPTAPGRRRCGMAMTRRSPFISAARCDTVQRPKMV